MNSILQPWSWPINLDAYDRDPHLTNSEQEAIEYAVNHLGSRSEQRRAGILQRLLQPIVDILAYLESPPAEHYAPIRIFLREMARQQVAYWGWTPVQWADLIAPNWDAFWQRHGGSGHKARQQVIVMAYVLARFKAFEWFPHQTMQIDRTAVAVFGAALERTAQRLSVVLSQWGYANPKKKIQFALADACLANESPHLEDLSLAFLSARRQQATSNTMANGFALISRAMAELKLIDGYLPLRTPSRPVPQRINPEGVAPEWLHWCTAWYDQSPLDVRTKENYFYYLRKVGLWLAEHHPQITSPEQWTYEVALEFATAVSCLKVGEYVQSIESARFAGVGKELMPRSKDNLLTVVRRFFSNLQEIPHRVNGHPARTISRQFNPNLIFQTPASIRRLIGPDPRVIDDAWWWKLLQAASDLQEADLPHSLNGTTRYPFAMVRALAMTWCYSALRSDEIKRLRVGCVRWQWDDGMLAEDGARLPEDTICFLHVPVNKTNTAFWKPVYALVGRCIQQWEAIRPVQPRALDRKTNQMVDFLFSYRGIRIGQAYINGSLIPLLCAKAGLPLADARGSITSHRARATIATLYYNCPEGLSGLEVQAFLGHTSFRSTQFYIKASPTKLAKAVARANKNSRLVKVLVDTQASIQGEPALFYDLGDGTFCGNPAWAACPHRMACIKCPMHVGVELAQVIRAREGVIHLLQEVPNLSDDERAAAEGDCRAFDKILAKQRGVAPPAVPNTQYIFNPAAQIVHEEALESAGVLPSKRTLPGMEHAMGRLPERAERRGDE